jgi:hypothetical protein
MMGQAQSGESKSWKIAIAAKQVIQLWEEKGDIFKKNLSL